MNLYKRADGYELGDFFGGNTRGGVFVATRFGQEFAFKRLKTGDARDAVEEAYILERCAEHPHIIT